MKVQSKKEGRYLVFNIDDGKGGTVKYDLATKEYIGKKGKPVKNLCSQLRGCSIPDVINGFEQETYKDFLKHVWESSKNYDYDYSNVGTFLTKVADYANHEQFFSAGIKKVETSRRITIADVPKGVIKMCKENPETMPIKDILITNFNQYTDLCNLIYSMRNEMQMFDCVKIMYEGTTVGYYRNTRLALVIQLIKDYNYNPKALLKYIDNIMVYEGANSSQDIIQLLRDYAQMSSRMSPKYDKYPRYLKTVHDITARNYSRLKEVFDEQAFTRKVNKDMELKLKDYVFIYPNTTSEIKEEAVQQSNCVASYVKNVIDGKCHIMFMRLASDPTHSLVTLEISPISYRVVQKKGRYNRDTTREEDEAIEKFNKHLQKLKETKGDK